MKKRFIFGIIAVFSPLLLIISGCTDWRNEHVTFYNEDFVYTYSDVIHTRRARKKGQYVAILALTDEGLQKDTIVVPEKIDGKPVVQLGVSGYIPYFVLAKGNNTKLYLPSSVVSAGEPYTTSSKKVFFNQKPSYEFIINHAKNKSKKVYVSKTVNEELISEYNDSITLVANVEFIVDNETYWIDDYDEESLIIVPENPVKEGYEFIGWYKEPECEIKWDFETDKVKGKTYDEENNLNINLTRLYAKWQKI